MVKSKLVCVMQHHGAIGSTEIKVQDIRVWYPDEYVGLHRCHLCSLYCVCPAMAKIPFEQKIQHDEQEKVKELVANNAEGDIFRVRKEAWVSLMKKHFIAGRICHEDINHSMAEIILKFSKFNFSYNTTLIRDKLIVPILATKLRDMEPLRTTSR